MRERPRAASRALKIEGRPQSRSERYFRDTFHKENSSKARFLVKGRVAVTTIEAIANVGADRRLVVHLPEEVSEGNHRVVLTVLDDAEMAENVNEIAEGGLEWEDGLLVYNGPISETLNIPQMINRHREERMSSVMFGDVE